MHLEGYSCQAWNDASGSLRKFVCSAGWDGNLCTGWWVGGGVEGAFRGRCLTRDGNSGESLPSLSLKVEEVLVPYTQQEKEQSCVQRAAHLALWLRGPRRAGQGH